MRERILAAGLAVWPNVTARAIGRELGISHTAVFYHFGTIDGLKAGVADHAVEVGNAPVIVQLIATHHPAAAGLSRADRARYMATV